MREKGGRDEPAAGRPPLSKARWRAKDIDGRPDSLVGGCRFTAGEGQRKGTPLALNMRHGPGLKRLQGGDTPSDPPCRDPDT